MSRVMVFGTSYVDSQERKWLAEQWLRVADKLNPSVEIGVQGTKGPVEWRPSLWRDQGFSFDEFEDNVGHLSKTGCDGWGRAFMHELRWIEFAEYDYAVHIECDLLFARPVMPIIEKMRKHGIKAISTFAAPYQFIETGLLFLDMAYVRKSRLIERYDWENPPVGRLPEHRIEDLLGDELFLLPLRGVRADGGLKAGYMGAQFPFGLDWLTHASVGCYRKFLEMNGLCDE